LAPSLKSLPITAVGDGGGVGRFGGRCSGSGGGGFGGGGGVAGGV